MSWNKTCDFPYPVLRRQPLKPFFLFWSGKTAILMFDIDEKSQNWIWKMMMNNFLRKRCSMMWKCRNEECMHFVIRSVLTQFVSYIIGF